MVWARLEPRGRLQAGLQAAGGLQAGGVQAGAQGREPEGGAPISILVCTVHLLHADTPEEVFSGYSPRRGQVRLVLRALRQLSRRGEATLLMGDFNDPLHPRCLDLSQTLTPSLTRTRALTLTQTLLTD